MSRKDVSLKKIAKNLGVECTGDDNRVCEVLCKIADEMPLIKGERVVKAPLEVGMDLQGKTIYFDTNKIVSYDGDTFRAGCQIPGLHIVFERDETGDLKGLVSSDYGFNEVFYEKGVWLKDSIVIEGSLGNTVIKEIDEEINEYVSTDSIEIGFMDRVSLYKHCLFMHDYNGTTRFYVPPIISNIKTPVTTTKDIEILNVNALMCTVQLNGSIYVTGYLSYRGYWVVEYYLDNETKTINLNELTITDTVTQII